MDAVVPSRWTAGELEPVIVDTLKYHKKQLCYAVRANTLCLMVREYEQAYAPYHRELSLKTMNSALQMLCASGRLVETESPGLYTLTAGCFDPM